LNLRNEWVYAISEVIFHPIGVVRRPFDENSRYYQKNPAPAFHQVMKQSGQKFLQT
jgi:hypothetical protein